MYIPFVDFTIINQPFVDTPMEIPISLLVKMVKTTLSQGDSKGPAESIPSQGLAGGSLELLSDIERPRHRATERVTYGKIRDFLMVTLWQTNITMEKHNFY